MRIDMDLISREALLKAFGLSKATRKHDGDGSGYKTMMLYEIQSIIEDAPELSCEGCVHDGMWDFDDDRPGPCDLCKRKAGDWYISREEVT